MSKQSAVPKDYVPGDEICKSCLGIAYLDKEMKKRKETYKCLGIKRTLRRTVPLEDLEKYDKETEDQQSGDHKFVKYTCIGN